MSNSTPHGGSDDTRPFIAAVVLAYNEARMLRVTLPRIKASVDQVIVVDMGSTDGSDEIYRSVLEAGDRVVPYPQSCLPIFGFANARNYGARFTEASFILSIDSDEWIAPTDDQIARETARAALESGKSVFHLPRSNYAGVKGLGLDDVQGLIGTARKSEELQRRLYRNRHDIRWEGLIHEELCDRDGNTWERAGECPLRLHHLSEYKEHGEKHGKQHLYAYMVLRAFTIPGFRYGTNEHWHTTFVVGRQDHLIRQAALFAEQHGAPRIDEEAVRERVQLLKNAQAELAGKQSSEDTGRPQTAEEPFDGLNASALEASPASVRSNLSEDAAKQTTSRIEEVGRSMTRSTDRDWTIIGAEEPYHGVLTQEQFLRRNLTPEILEGFWSNGADEINCFKLMIEQHFGAFAPRAALDFGCGVGRLTRAMASIASRVRGVDVSPGMLAEARQGAPANIEFTDSIGDGPYDWINSVMVFQHIPPSRGYAIFEDLVARLAPGGVLSIQVTLYRDARVMGSVVDRMREATWDGEVLRGFHQSEPQPGTIMMYDYDLDRLLATAIRGGVGTFFLEHTDHGGCHGVRIFGRRMFPSAYDAI